jgi:phosphomannomutase
VRDLRVVLDAANGMAGLFLPPALERLAIDAVPFFLDLDGTFPNHEPNPLLPENREFVIGKVREEGADLGIAFDGDADRCFFIDDAGEFVPGDFLTALLAESILAKEPGATILYDVRASRAVPDTVERLGGRALVNRVGHAFFKARMREENAAFGGEVSGHYYFRRFWCADSGVIPALLVLELLSVRGKTMVELLEPFREKYFISGEINSTVADPDAKMKQIAERYSDCELTWLDGVSVDCGSFHFNVRPSNTEPLLRLNLEAFSKDELEARTAEVLALIRS